MKKIFYPSSVALATFLIVFYFIFILFGITVLFDNSILTFQKIIALLIFIITLFVLTFLSFIYKRETSLTLSDKELIFKPAFGKVKKFPFKSITNIYKHNHVAGYSTDKPELVIVTDRKNRFCIRSYIDSNELTEIINAVKTGKRNIR